MFVLNTDGKVSVIEVYVDDLIMMTEDDAEMSQLKEALSSRFNMKDLGEIHYCLGMQVTRDTETGEFTLHQGQYIRNILQKFGMTDACPTSTPSDTNVRLVKDDGCSKPVDVTYYKSILGSLLYVAMGTRPDIAHAVAAAAKFSSAPTELHLTAVKRVLRYLRETQNLSLHYSPGDGELISFSDADWAGDRDDRKSTTGNIHMLSGAAVSWLSKKQPIVALSTAESEYIALCLAAQETMHLRRLLCEIGLEQTTTRMLEDNQGAIALARNPVNHSRTKHIDIKYHYVRQAVEENIIALEYCPTSEMIADILTKPLPRTQFIKLRRMMGLY